MLELDDPGPDFELAWPREVFRAEARALLDQGGEGWLGRAELLLEEAFASDVPRDRLRALGPDLGTALVAWAQGRPNPHRAFVQELLDAVDHLPDSIDPRAYWPERQGRRLGAIDPLRELQAQRQAGARLRRDWAAAVARFDEQGYLDRVAPARTAGRDQELARALERRLGMADLWPLRPQDWSEDDLFYALVEAVGDLVARPRIRLRREQEPAGWTYSSFAAGPGRALYRAAINPLLTRAGTTVQLAAVGSDAGRLVQVAGDDRDRLVQQVLATPELVDRYAVEHAVALFRARAAGREDKRSAVAALARLLEDRRKLLKQQLFRRDEGALFQIANDFDLRHRRADQRTDYDEAYLDWVFWWYLATVELTDRLLAREGGTT